MINLKEQIAENTYLRASLATKNIQAVVQTTRTMAVNVNWNKLQRIINDGVRWETYMALETLYSRE